MAKLTLGKHTLEVRFSFPKFREIAKETEIDLMAAPRDNNAGLMAMLLDPSAAIEAAWILVRDDAGAVGMGRDAYEAACDADGLLAIMEALNEALIDFFHYSPAIQEALRAARAEAEQRQGALIRLAHRATSDQFEQLIENFSREASGNGPSDSPAGSGSPITTT